MPKSTEYRSNIEEAYRGIKRLMLAQKLVPGQKLPYRELTERLGMSKTPIINALNRLEQEGFIISEPNVGYAVKPISEKEIIDSYEVREALEVKALQRAIESGTAGQLADLEEKYRAFDQYRPPRCDRKKMMLDCEFHLQMAAMSGNEVLRYLLRRNFEHIILRTRMDNYAWVKWENSVNDIKDLMEKIRAREFSSGAEILIRHIRDARDNVLSTIRSENQEGMDTASLFEFGA